MPGKYSHSVVLASYSSQGIISLPNDQHIHYLRSTSAPSSSGTTPTNSVCSQSAQSHTRGAAAPTRDPTPSRTSPVYSGTGTPSANGVSNAQASFVGSPQSQSLTRRIIIDSDSEDDETVQGSGLKIASLSKYSSGQAVQAVHQPRSQHGLRPATASQRSTLPRRESPVPISDQSQAAVVAKSELDDNSPSIISHNTPNRSDFGIPISSHTASPKVWQTSVTSDLSSNSFVEQLGHRDQKRLSGLSSGQTSFLDSSLKTAHHETMPPKVQRNETTRPSSSRQTSMKTQQTRIFAPEEPNFDGFSDTGDEYDDYFEGHVSRQAGSTDQESDLDLALFAPVFSRNPPDSEPQQMSRNLQSSMSTSSCQGDASIQSTVAAASLRTTPDFTSFGSMSSTSSWDAGMGPKSNERVEPLKSHLVTSTKQLGRELPEIKEDLDLAHSIFEEGPRPSQSSQLSSTQSSDLLKYQLSVPTLGQISSGRDVNFHNSDAQSELSAIFPPDIGRHRDEDSEFAANVAAMTGQSQPAESRIPDGRIAPIMVKKKGAQSRGLFARFKSRIPGR